MHFDDIDLNGKIIHIVNPANSFQCLNRYEYFVGLDCVIQIIWWTLINNVDICTKARFLRRWVSMNNENIN